MPVSMKTLISIYALILGGMCIPWNVVYNPMRICALEGSSVTMSCSYTYPSSLTVKEAFWTHQDSSDPTDISKNERLKIVSSKRGGEVDAGDNITLTCSTTCNLPDSPSFIWSKDGRPVEEKQIIYNQLQLHPVSYKDEGNYTCAVKGHEGFPSLPMKIQVMCPVVVSSDTEHVKEGDHVTLTCSTTCNLTDSPSFIWSKDGRPVEKKQIINNQLQLHPVSYEDEGNYTCVVRGHEGLPSPPYRLHVMSKERSLFIAALVGVAVCGVVGLVCVLYWLRIRMISGADAPPTAEAAARTEDDVQYDSVQPKHHGQTAGGQGDDAQNRRVQLEDNRQTAGGQGDDAQNRRDQPEDKRQTAGGPEDDVLYTSVYFKTDGAQKRSLGPPEGEPSVIYSSLKKSM
ncbi:B-cell receptor CD22-like [Sardina pilchardus]|uniref:B-cell receptor CD22-like n=1 Tax=Sardina pilchardus TaxID=27697 RepID=UPI002E0E30AF